MNEEEELGGNFKYPLVLTTILLLLSCGKENFNQKLSAQNVIDICSDDFPAAAYNLGDRESLFSNPDLFAGQPIYYFSESLTKEEKQLLKERFLNSFKGKQVQDQIEISNQFLRWCEFNKLINEMNQDLSTEEVFLHLAQSSVLSSILDDILPVRSLTKNEKYTLDDFATLASAELHFIHQQLLTELSKLPMKEYEAAKADVERTISSQKDS